MIVWAYILLHIGATAAILTLELLGVLLAKDDPVPAARDEASIVGERAVHPALHNARHGRVFCGITCPDQI